MAEIDYSVVLILLLQLIPRVLVLVSIKQTLSQLCSNLIIYQTTIENKHREKPNQIKKREENLSTCLCFKFSIPYLSFV